MDLIYEWHHDVVYCYFIYLFFLAVILTYIVNLEIAFLLPTIHNVRLDFFDRPLLEILEDVSRWERTQKWLYS